jgi:hypothetical protein
MHNGLRSVCKEFCYSDEVLTRNFNLGKELYHGDPRITRLRSESFSLLLLFALCLICCPFMYNFLYVSSYMNTIFMFRMLMNAL